MAITFNGTQKLIECSTGTIELEVQAIYSAWKEWMQSGNGINFLPAFEVIGGQPLPGGLFAGRTFFLLNGWKIKPQAADHRLTIAGNLYTDDGSPVSVSVPGYTIEISLTTSAQAQGIQTSGSAFSVADIWGYSSRTLTSAGAGGGATLAEIEASAVLAKVSDVQAVPTATESVLLDEFSAVFNAIANIPAQTWNNPSRTLTSDLAKSSDISGLQSFIAPYLEKINTLWISNGHDSTNPISAMPPSSLLPGWVRSQNLSINQTHRQNQDGSFTLSTNV
ncbi:MAG: hypothetical protein F6K21_03300 [Symploca sp. SIO2D2]|nr:hypothetical protein [Symploca sp. SIO2D2]